MRFSFEIAHIKFQMTCGSVIAKLKSICIHLSPRSDYRPHLIINTKVWLYFLHELYNQLELKSYSYFLGTTIDAAKGEECI